MKDGPKQFDILPARLKYNEKGEARMPSWRFCVLCNSMRQFSYDAKCHHSKCVRCNGGLCFMTREHYERQHELLKNMGGWQK